MSLREARQWPFRLLEVREGFMIDGVDPESFRTKRFTRGDLVTSIDGVTIEDWIDREARDVFASTDASRRWWAVFRLGASTSSAQIQVVTIARGETNPRTVRAPCVPLESPVPHMSWEPNERIVRELDAETGYFRPGSFVATNGGAFKNAAPEARDEVLAQDYESLRDVFEQIESKSKLVLDLRQNPGGTDLIAQALARHLLEPGFVYYSLSSKRDGLWVNPFEQRPRVGYSRPSFGGKLAVLIDARTFSTADNLACCLRDSHPDVRFVGQQTGSGSGAPRTFELPSTKARVTFCTMRVYAPGGKPVEGYGVRPDVEVLRTRDEVLNDIDVGLDAALRSLR
ncbi:MAG: hypothetical protein KDC95_04955 [Planctomycetes bacterium]|nr:hypothetical protein [Planctomycetota bacterium]